MDLIKTNVDDLNATITVKVHEADYKPQVDKALKTTAKQAQIPGFRKGMVPVGMIKKMYGKSIMADELNKIISSNLNQYILDNKLDLLGHPLPKTDDVIDFDKGGDFEFNYEIGLAPSLQVNFAQAGKFNYYKVAVDQDLIAKYKRDITRRYGKYETPELVGDADLVYIALKELNNDGTINQNGLSKTSSVAVDLIKSDSFKSSILNKKVNETVKVNAKDLGSSSFELGTILGLTNDEAEKITADFEITLTSISRVIPAEINDELFKSLYGEGIVNNEAEFHAKINEELSNMFVADSDRRLRYELQKTMLDKLNPSLPDNFLKKWIASSNEKPITVEQINNEYTGYAKGLKIQLIENKIAAEYNIKVEEQEVIDYTKDMLTNQYFKNAPDMDESFLNDTAKRVLENEQEARRIAEQIFEKKISKLYKEKLQLNEVELNYEDFVKKVNEA